MGRTYLIISIVALITCLIGIPHLVTGIMERGMDGVNYGRVIYPFLISGIAFWLYRKNRPSEK